MRETVLYIAASMDGYIADLDGNIDWLLAFDSSQSSYEQFLKSVDTILMGSTTYKQLITELSPTIWPYADKEVFVASRQPQIEDKHVTFVEDAVKVLRELKEANGKTIWIVGGAKLVESLFDAELIDTIILTTVPVSIGKGIPLFPDKRLTFNLVKSEILGPFVESTYKIISNDGSPLKG